MSASIRPTPRKGRKLTRARPETCKKTIVTRNNGKVVPFPRETSVPSPSPEPTPQPPTEAEINEAIHVLARRREAIAHDAGLTAAFQRQVDIEVLGRPSGVSPPELETSLPVRPPALWLDRTDRQQTPPEFIATHYAAWLGKGLSRPDIKRLDSSLYNALNKWLQEPQGGIPGAPKNVMPDGLKLLTKSEAVSRELTAEGITADTAHQPNVRSYLRKQARLAAATKFRFG